MRFNLKHFFVGAGIVYFVLYTFPFPLNLIPGSDFLSPIVKRFWDVIIVWVGANVFGLAEPVATGFNGSGDRTYNYLMVFVALILAVIGGGIWLALRIEDERIAKIKAWAIIFVRYYLGSVLLFYGIAKVIKSQFPFPFLDRLLTPYGESSPMALLWTFMGYSTPYTMFAGLGEMVGGLLLFLRRTTTLGALILAGVMLNVFMMNMSYDVPVKLYSAHLLFMAGLLLWRDRERLTAIFVRNQATAAFDEGVPFQQSKVEQMAASGKSRYFDLLNLFNRKSRLAGLYAMG